jgi:enoyl-CoA hydratase/3-hydroxyacyl-CoA dehydrogenase
MEFDDVETVAVLGAGSMGHGIAEVAALAGYEVTLRDIDEEFVRDGYDRLVWSLDKLAEKDRIDDDEAEAAKDRITPLVDLEDAVSDADVVIEAVPERMDVKKEVYSEVEQYLPEDAIIASNTSSLSITELSEVTERPGRFCGMHFFNPPVRMQLVEVVTGAHTEESTLGTVEALAEAFGKTPIRVRKDSPGFVVNRVLVPLMNEACHLVSAGEATVKEVDSTAKFDMGLPMGAFELADLTGNDVNYSVLEYMHETLGDAYEPAPLLEEKVENEELGKKTGKGFYGYDEGEGVVIPPDAGSEEIERRLLAAMANEVGELVADDVSTPADIDRALRLGAGFPEGPAKTADEHGLDDLVAVLEERHEATGHPRFEVSEGLREAAERGGFHGDGGSEDRGLEFETLELQYPAGETPESSRGDGEPVDAEGVAHLVLSREARMNTINDTVLDELEAAIDALEADESVRALLITGQGDRAFSAGADVTSMASSAEPLEARKLMKRGQSVFGKLESARFPVVAGIDGYCLGGGMELATCADLRVASERSEFGQPELNLGLIPGWGGTQRLGHVVGEGRAREIVLTAERYDAETMYDYGFVNEVTPNDELLDRAMELTADLAAGPPIAQEMAKTAMLKGREDTEAGLEIEAQAAGHLVGTEDVMEGVTAFVSDRDPEFEGK